MIAIQQQPDHSLYAIFNCNNEEQCNAKTFVGFYRVATTGNTVQITVDGIDYMAAQEYTATRML